MLMLLLLLSCYRLVCYYCNSYGFILGESDMAGRTAGPATAAAVRRQRSASQVGVCVGCVCVGQGGRMQ